MVKIMLIAINFRKVGMIFCLKQQETVERNNTKIFHLMIVFRSMQ